MRLNVSVKARYPKFYQYVRDEIPMLALYPNIVRQIAHLTNRTPNATIMNALRWGVGPEITLTLDLLCGGERAFGCHRFGTDELQIDESLASDFDAGRGVCRTLSGRRVYLIGATLLHELTHWACGTYNPDGEDGNAFEVAVYGRVLP